MKKPLLLIVVLAALLGLYWLVQSKKPVVEADRPFVEVDSAKVVGLEITTGGELVVLSKEGDTWKVIKPLQFPAAQKTVQMALERFKQMKRLSLISEKAGRFREFQVDDSAGVKVRVSDGKKGTTFYLGKTSSTGNTYARIDGTNEIWEVAGNQTGTFKKKARDWRDKTITELNQADFRKLNFRYPGTGKGMIATKLDTVWKVETPTETFTAFPGMVDRVTGLLSRMSAVDFADSLQPELWNKPVFDLIADMTDGTTINLKLIAKDADENQYYVRKAGAPTDYVIYKATANVLMKQPADFKEKPAGDAAGSKKPPRKQ
jgi:hypothetical protein